MKFRLIGKENTPSGIIPEGVSNALRMPRLVGYPVGRDMEKSLDAGSGGDLTCALTVGACAPAEVFAEPA